MEIEEEPLKQGEKGRNGSKKKKVFKKKEESVLVF